jgi:AcrR family transcriptional regulator
VQDHIGPDRHPDQAPRTAASATRRGRPRQPATDAGILRATIELLTEVGVAGTTTDAIVARSGRSKTTIYRRWPTRNALILDAIRTVFAGQPEDIRDSIEAERRLGSTIRAAARRAANVFDSPLFRETFPTISAELLGRGSIGQRFRSDVFMPVRDAAKGRLLAGATREELNPTVDPDLVFDMVYGALLYRALMGEPVDSATADALATLVLSGVGLR